MDKELEAILARAKALEDRVGEMETKSAKEKETISTLLSGGIQNMPRSNGGSDEARAMMMFGVKHPAELVHVNTSDPRFKKVPPELKFLVRELKRAVDVSRWTAQMFHGAPQDKIGTASDQDRVGNVKGLLDTYYGKTELAPRLKAFGSTVSGGGDEWVPTLMSSSYVEEFELDRVVEDKFREIPLGSAPYDLPIQTSVTKARKIAENTAITGANFTTGKITFSPTKLGEYYVLPEELNEDSAPAIFDIARSEVVQAQARAVEAAILNGDSDGTHIDSDTQALGADVAEKIWNGLRRAGIANTANGGTTDFTNAAITEANLRVMRQRMGKFGVNPGQLMWIVSAVGLQQMMALPSVITIDKYGQFATVVTGEIGRYQGIPIITSEYMRSDLNATGVYDGTTVNRTALLLVNTTRYYVGMRRPIRVRVMEDLPNQDRWLMASYQRKDFQGHAQSATEVSVSYGYNVAV